MTPEASPSADARAAHLDRSNKAFEQVKELFKTIVGALAIALVFRSFLLEPFNIPSGSMEANLLIGDYLLVEKWPYGYSRYSFPFGPPILDGRVPDVQPHRGDVVVFKTPYDNRTDFIKRLIGLPGDQIEVRDGVLYLNGQTVPKVRAPDAVIPITRGEDCAEAGAGNRFELTSRETVAGGATAVCRYRQYRETLPGGKSYVVLDQSTHSMADNYPAHIVPEGHYFMMGDNRDNSADSRFTLAEGGVGDVPAENLVGRAAVLFFSLDGSAHWWEVWRWPQSIRVSRIGKLL